MEIKRQELEIPKEMNLRQQTRDILLLHYKKSFSEEALASIFSLPISKVYEIIHNFAACFSNEQYMKNVIESMSKMNREQRHENACNSTSLDAKDREIAELRKQLTQAQIKSEFYEKMIDIAEKNFKISIRKKFGAK